MEILLIKDLRGKEHLVFKKEDINEYDEMGSKVDDFEILQVLGVGSFGFVAKVKSRLNHKIYAMKKINFEELKKQELIDLCVNETKILSKLSDSYITKYYKTIKDGMCLYIIMEFMDNGDLGGLLKAHKILGKPIEEEKLFDIFIKAMQGLKYIHSKKLCHRDIKPENLFISVDGEVKLGDFGVSAAVVDKKEKNKNMQYLNDYQNNNIKDSVIGDIICNQTVVGTPPFMSPEMLFETKYNLKTDVYSMGVTFFELCFWHLPRVPIVIFDGSIRLADVPIKNNKNIYSKELIDIINKMKEMDKNKRPDAEAVLNMLLVAFNKKYSNNSSISAVLSCLYSFEKMTEYFKKQNNQNYLKNNEKKNPISFAYLYGINSINNEGSEDWNNVLFKIRNIINMENDRYSGNKEIETGEILSHLLAKIHRELNKLHNTNIIKKQSHEIELKNKEEAFKIFYDTSKSMNKSVIYDYFYGVMKTKTCCSQCGNAKYSFNYYYYISFDLNLAMKYKKNNDLSLEKLFDIQNDICIKIGMQKSRYCEKCKLVQIHYQRKQFYCFPHFLIVCLERGNNCNNKEKILYDIKLNLDGKCEYGNTKFKLVGIVKRLDKNGKEHYISLYYDYKIQSWILRDDSSITKIDSPIGHKQGTEMILFYRAESGNNIVKKNSNKQIDDFYQ